MLARSKTRNHHIVGLSRKAAYQPDNDGVLKGAREVLVDTFNAVLSRCANRTRLLAKRALSDLWRVGFPSSGAIMMLHEVHDDPDNELGTGCRPGYLEYLVRHLRAKGAELVSMDRAIELITTRAHQPFVVLTFDDGYRDTWAKALPILERLSAPCCIYVPTHAITRELNAWWLAAREIFRRYDAVDVSCMERRFSCTTLDAKRAALREVCNWVARDFTRASSLDDTFANYDVHIVDLVEKYFLSQSELQLLARNPLATLGGHTTSHRALATLSADAVHSELAENRQFLQNATGREVRHIAYPYGSSNACGPRDFEMAKNLGFASATTSESRPLYRYESADLRALPRIDFSADFWVGMNAINMDDNGPSPYIELADPRFERN